MCQSSANEVSILHVLPNLNLVPLSRYLDKRSYNLAHLLRKILGSRALNRNIAESALYIHAMALDSRPSCSIWNPESLTLTPPYSWMDRSMLTYLQGARLTLCFGKHYKKMSPKGPNIKNTALKHGPAELYRHCASIITVVATCQCDFRIKNT